MLPAAPWDSPTFADSERVGHGEDLTGADDDDVEGGDVDEGDVADGEGDEEELGIELVTDVLGVVDVTAGCAGAAEGSFDELQAPMSTATKTVVAAGAMHRARC